MWTAKQIWEAGRAALAAAQNPPAPTPAPAASAPADEAETASEDFEMTALQALGLEDRPYRVHFRGGTSGEYDGYTLRTSAPFDLADVVSIDPV
jgi:hypothetical protein